MLIGPMQPLRQIKLAFFFFFLYNCRANQSHKCRFVTTKPNPDIASWDVEDLKTPNSGIKKNVSKRIDRGKLAFNKIGIKRRRDLRGGKEREKFENLKPNTWDYSELNLNINMLKCKCN